MWFTEVEQLEGNLVEQREGGTSLLVIYNTTCCCRPNPQYANLNIVSNLFGLRMLF